MNTLVRIELDRIDWSKLRDVKCCFEPPVVSSDWVPKAMLDLIDLRAPDKDGRWQYPDFEGRAFLPDNLFEVCEYLVPVFLAALVEPIHESPKGHILEALSLIVSADGPHRIESNYGNSNLLENCRTRAREGLWIFYQELTSGSVDAVSAYLILRSIEPCQDRLARVLKELDLVFDDI